MRRNMDDDFALYPAGVPLEISVIVAALWEQKVHQEGTNERTKKIRSLVNLILVGLDEKQVKQHTKYLQFIEECFVIHHFSTSCTLLF